jgi:hypothetical protein
MAIWWFMTCLWETLAALRNGRAAIPSRWTAAAVLGLALLVSTPVWSSTLYTRPPYGLVLVWPSSSWHLASYGETGDTLGAVLARGGGEREEAGILIRALRMPGLEGETVLPLFHRMMETTYAEEARDFSRASSLSPCTVAGELGCRSEMRWVSHDQQIVGSIVSFVKGDVYYNIVFDATQELHAVASAEFEQFLAQARFAAAIHPLMPAVPPEILSLSMPIRELTWPPLEPATGLIVPSVVSYNSDRTHYVALRVADEGEWQRALRRAPIELTKECSEVEETLGPCNWKEAMLRIPGIETLCQETEIAMAGTRQYAGIACWASGSRVFVLTVVGVADEYSLESVAQAISVVLDLSVPRQSER